MVFPRRWRDQCGGVLFGLALSAAVFLNGEFDASSWFGILFLTLFSVSLFARVNLD